MEYSFKKGASLQNTSPRPSSLLLEEGGREERNEGEEGRREGEGGKMEEGEKRRRK